MKSRSMLFLLPFLMVLSIKQVLSQQLSVYDLHSDYLKNPVGISNAPHFSWKIRSTGRDVLQTAYEIRIGSDSTALSKGRKLIGSPEKTNSNQSIRIPYKGPDLRSGQRYYWQVRVWDNQGHSSPWSAVNYWEMGLLSAEDWQSKWISSRLAVEKEGPAILFRKTFQADPGILRARLYISAQGIYETQINGKRVGNDYFRPGWTAYKERIQYQVYDISSQVAKGDNVLAVSVGDGWFRGNLPGGRNFYGKEEALIAQIRIDYKNGKTETVGTDGSWKVSDDGPIRKSDFYNGEYYDARKELSGWSSPGFQDGAWKAATIRTDISYQQLVSPPGPPTRETEIVKAKEIIQNDQGEKIIDFGQNLVGWVRFTVQGNAGDSIVLKHAEVLDKNGHFYTENLRAAEQKIVYVLKGNGPETYEPHFTFQGFRYVKIEGNKDLISTGNAEAVVLHADMAITGSFETSNPLLNQLQHNIQWGQKGNFVDVPTDCPQRDERLGWTGDAQAFFNTAAYNMDVAGFFEKWLQDVKADQFSSGAIPHVIPNFWKGEQGGSAGWADVSTIVPWNFYQAYGDSSILRSQYASMKNWIRYIEDHSEQHIWTKGGHFGDWLFYIPDDDRDGKAAITDKQLIAQAFYIYSLSILVKTSQVLNEAQDGTHYQEQLEQAKAAFVHEFMTPSGRLVSSSQTAYVLALQFDILPDSLRAGAADRLVDNIRSYGNHLTTGFLGTPYLCHVLSRFGHLDVAYTLLLQETYPSWLYPVKKGATTVWERWDGIKPDGSFQNKDMNSFNHYAYGAIGEWMYKHIAGIQHAENEPGYRKFTIAPQPGGGLTTAKGSLETPYGNISSAWKINGKQMDMDVEVPENTTATIVFPQADPESLTADGKKATLKDGSLAIGSGRYHFSFQMR